MATPRPRPPKPPHTFKFVPDDNHIGTYSDIFTVEMEAGTGMVSLTFFQSGSKFEATQFGAPQEVKEKEVRFLSKIVLSPRGFETLFNSMLSNAQIANEAVAAAIKAQEQEKTK
jgi:hypothetical protein